MADLFLSYSRADQERAATVAAAVEEGGRSLWWDRRLASGAEYASVIEQEIEAAETVVVGWSSSARESLWVRAESNEALDQGKLVQINFDGAKPPLPFNMLHFIDFRGWPGQREAAPWPEFEARISGDSRETERTGAMRPEPGGLPPLRVVREPPLQGFGRVAMLGWASLGVAVSLALSVLLVARGLISAEAFGIISVAGAVLAALLLVGSASVLLRIQAASRA